LKQYTFLANDFFYRLNVSGKPDSGCLQSFTDRTATVLGCRFGRFRKSVIGRITFFYGINNFLLIIWAYSKKSFYVKKGVIPACPGSVSEANTLSLTYMAGKEGFAGQPIMQSYQRLLRGLDALRLPE